MDYSNSNFLLVEPIAKTPYPPLGLLKISSMLKDKYKKCRVFSQIGKGIPNRGSSFDKIFVTSLFTWDWKPVVECIRFYQVNFPNSEILVGGIGASLIHDHIYSYTGIRPHVGLYHEAECYIPDYSMTFGRQNGASITFTSRGCPRNCEFCSVKQLEPTFFVRENWEKDIKQEYPRIILWDNNFLASPNFESDCRKIEKFNKKVDFNQGLDARLLTEERAKILFRINIDPIRLAFDDAKYENDILKAINIVKSHSNKEIMTYVLYNFRDTPEDLYYRINLLNKEGVLSFPMEYRAPTNKTSKIPGPNWNLFLLRAFKLTLIFYYRKGMITRSRESFESIYGKDEREFVSRLYEIYEYDKRLKRKSTHEGESNG